MSKCLLSALAALCRPFSVPLSGVLILLVLTGCSAVSAKAELVSAASTATELPGGHVHGMSVESSTGGLVLATHEGIFQVSGGQARLTSEDFDARGFAAGAEKGVYFASGHPSPGSDRPDPLGLIRTHDGGKTWEGVSRQGESDFQALAVGKSGIVAFDGTLRTSVDGAEWKSVPAPFAPLALAAEPGSDTVLATTRGGLQRSTNAGNSWNPVASGAAIELAAFADSDQVFGVAADGVVYASVDAGSSWARKGRISLAVEAITATIDRDGGAVLYAATSQGLMVSTDGGSTFEPSSIN